MTHATPHVRPHRRFRTPPKVVHPAVVDHGGMDAAVLTALEKHGPQDPMSLLHRVEGRGADIVDRVCALVVARRVRVDAECKFTLPTEVAA